LGTFFRQLWRFAKATFFSSLFQKSHYNRKERTAEVKGLEAHSIKKILICIRGKLCCHDAIHVHVIGHGRQDALCKA
jgi:hypothetical protein